MQTSNQLLAAQSGLATWTSAAIAVARAGFRVVSATLSWGAVASTAGALSVEGSDDGATWVPLTVSTVHGTWPTVGASAGAAVLVLANCPGYVRFKYTRSAGGGASQFATAITLTE